MQILVALCGDRARQVLKREVKREFRLRWMNMPIPAALAQTRGEREFRLRSMNPLRRSRARGAANSGCAG